jgi:hypothetical protein
MNDSAESAKLSESEGELWQLAYALARRAIHRLS